MIKYPGPKYPPRKHRPIRAPRRSGPPPLVLAGAFLAPGDDDLWLLRVTFDRAIDWDALVPSAFAVSDGAGTGTAYVGSAMYDSPDPESIEIIVESTGPATGATTLTVTGANGIVAVDNAGTWGGVVALPLPFP